MGSFDEDEKENVISQSQSKVKRERDTCMRMYACACVRACVRADEIKSDVLLSSAVQGAEQHNPVV